MLLTKGMEQRQRALRAQIAALKRELLQLDEFRPGSLSRQYNVCGSPGCRCKAKPPQKHGPYYHLSYTRKGKGGTRSVNRADLPLIRTQLANYTRLRALVDRWIDLASELSDLMLQAQHVATAAPRKRR
jgi:Family of unknown function (DUF6788)